jgi:CHASE3 domain sensor protein
MIATNGMEKFLFWLGLALPLLALAALIWLVHQSDRRFNTSVNWVIQNYQVLDLFEQTQSHLMDAEANERGYRLTGRAEYLEPYRNALSAVQDNLSKLKRLTQNDPAQQANLLSLGQLVTNEWMFDPATAFASGQTPAGTSVVKLTGPGRQKIEDLRAVLFQAREEQERTLNNHQAQARDDVLSNRIMSLLLITTVAVALILVVIILLRLKKLHEFVTVCVWTNRVRFQGQWLRLDEYLKKQFNLTVSHSLSPEAAEEMRIEIEELNRPAERPPPPPQK